MSGNLPAPPGPQGGSSGLVSDLLGLGSLGEKLLGLVADSVQGLARPWQTRRTGTADTAVRAHDAITMAKAHAETALINADLQEELERRALARLRAREVSRQANLESTVGRAVKHLQGLEGAAQAEARHVEDDWMQAFLRYVEDVSHEAVQQLWARVLTDQLRATRPPVSLATLDSLRLMEPRLARAFNRVLDLWMAFGKCMDQVNDQYAPGTFHVFQEEHLVLQSIGLVDIESRLDNFISFHGYGLMFRDARGGSENVHVTRLEPSWRGKELARVIRPDLFEQVERGEGGVLGDSLGDWSGHDVRAGTLSEWAQSLSTLCGELHLVGKASSSEDSAGRITVQNVETHRWVGHWEPIAGVSEEVMASVYYPRHVLEAR